MRPVTLSKTLALAAILAATCAAPTFAQAPVQTAGGADPAPGAADGYVGASKEAFYSVEQRIAALDAMVASGKANRAVRAQLTALKAFEARQRARHGGELRDWDREAMTARLNRIEAMVAG